MVVKTFRIHAALTFAQPPDGWCGTPPPPPQGCIRREEGGGSGTQKFVYQKWPNQISPTVNFCFFPQWSLWSGGGGVPSSNAIGPFQYPPPPPSQPPGDHYNTADLFSISPFLLAISVDSLEILCLALLTSFF